MTAIAAVRYRASIAVLNVETAVHSTVKAGRAVKPRAGADEETVDEPVGAVVAVRSSVVRSVVIVSVGTCGFGSAIDGHLSLRVGSGSHDTDRRNDGSERTIESVHKSSSQSSGSCRSQCMCIELRIHAQMPNSQFHL